MLLPQEKKSPARTRWFLWILLHFNQIFICKSLVHFFLAAMHRVVSEYEVIETKSSNIRVFVRARPLENDAEPGDFLQPGEDGKRLVIKDPDPNNKKYTEVAFQFDKVFWTGISQAAVFDEVCKAQVDHVLNGYNSCCFACKFNFLFCSLSSCQFSHQMLCL
jgi:hypothetical protein